MRRNLIHLALALALVPATVVLVLRMMPEPPPSMLAFARPMHRVAVALEEAMKAEFTSVQHGRMDLSQDSTYQKADGRWASMDEVRLPEDQPLFWCPSQDGSTPPRPTRISMMVIEGVARFGREVKVVVKPDPFNSKGTVLDFQGDAAAAGLLRDRIAGRLDHPRHPHESPEDRAALMAFLGPKPAPPKPTPAVFDPSIHQATAPAALDPKDAVR